jgi:hypothetical protein
VVFAFGINRLVFERRHDPVIEPPRKYPSFPRKRESCNVGAV